MGLQAQAIYTLMLHGRYLHFHQVRINWIRVLCKEEKTPLEETPIAMEWLEVLQHCTTFQTQRF